MTAGIDIDALKAALAVAEARAANAAAKVSDAAAEIVFLRLTIEKLRRELYGWRSERKPRLLDQLEFQLDELEASATEADLAAAGTTEVKGSRGASRPATRFRCTCRASGWSCRRRRPVHAAARRSCRRSART